MHLSRLTRPRGLDFMQRMRSGSLVVLTLLPLACAVDTLEPLPTTSTTSSTSTTGGDGGQGGEGANAAVAGSGGGTAVGGAAGDGSGRVGVYDIEAGTVHGATVSAGFWHGFADCIITTDGSCEIFECTSFATTFASAGTVHITGGDRNVDLSPNANNVYLGDYAQLSVFSTGQTLTIAADGAEVPAFSDSLVAPALITLTAPTLAGTSVTIPTTTPWSLSWTGGSTGDVVVSLSSGLSGVYVAVQCAWPSSMGAATVPVSTLSYLQGGMGYYNIDSVVTATINPGGWDIGLSLRSAAISSTAFTGYAFGNATYP